MIFLYPEYLYLMLLPLLFLIFLIFTNKSRLDRFFNEKTLKKIKIDDGTIGQKGRNILLFSSAIMMILALARPVLPKGEVEVKSSSVDILVGIDISKSMLAKDIYPNRLKFAKKRVIEFMNSFKKARFGVVAFSGAGFLVSPLSEDIETLTYLVNNLNPDSISQKGTDLMTPLQLAKRFLKEDKQKILVLFTDGGDDKDFTQEINFAKKYGIKVYIYAIGTKKGSVIEENSSILKDKNGNIVIVRLNENIKKLAFQSGGAFIVGGYSKEGIKKLEASIKKDIKIEQSREKKIKIYKELFYYPMWAAFFLMLVGFSSLPIKKAGSSLFILLFLLFQPHLKAGILDFQEISKAKNYYNEGKFEKSQKIYQKLMKSKKSDELIYDLANTLYKQKKYKEAIKEYEKIQSKDKNLKFKKFFNEGNSYAFLKEFDKAVKSYEKALKIKDDKDAKYNLELIKKLMKKKKQQKKQNKKKDGNKKKKNNKNGKNKRNQNKKGNNSDKKDKKQNGKKNQQKKSGKQKPKKGNKENSKKKNSLNKAQKRIKKKYMSDMEEKKWTREMMKNREKTLPIKIKTKIHKIGEGDKNW